MELVRSSDRLLHELAAEFVVEEDSIVHLVHVQVVPNLIALNVEVSIANHAEKSPSQTNQVLPAIHDLFLHALNLGDVQVQRLDELGTHCAVLPGIVEELLGDFEGVGKRAQNVGDREDLVGVDVLDVLLNFLDPKLVGFVLVLGRAAVLGDVRTVHVGLDLDLVMPLDIEVLEEILVALREVFSLIDELVFNGCEERAHNQQKR